MGARSTDPMVGFHFGIEVQGIISGYFTECSGLGSENDVVDHKVIEGGFKQIVQKIPGRLKWGDITLKRGITAQMDFWDWRKMVEDGKVNDARKNGTITMYDESLSPIAQWDFVNGWPSKISGPQLQADTNAYGIEEITIVHEGIKRTK